MVAGVSESGEPGDGSIQYQGLDNDLVVQHAYESAQITLSNQQFAALQMFSLAARDEGARRIQAFNDLLLESLALSNDLAALSEPSIQTLVRRAQLSAANSGDANDYEMLTQLVGSCTSNKTKTWRAANQAAVEIVDSLDENALRALCFMWLLAIWRPSSHDLDGDLQAFDERLAQLDIDTLPVGVHWQAHLETLGLVRIHTKDGDEFMPDPTPLKSPAQKLAAIFRSYTCCAVDRNTANTFNTFLQSKGFWRLPIKPHPLHAGLVRVDFFTRAELVQALVELGSGHEMAQKIADRAAKEVFLGAIDPAYSRIVVGRALEFKYIRKMLRWLDQGIRPIDVTQTGRVLCYAKLTIMLPDFELSPPRVAL